MGWSNGGKILTSVTRNSVGMEEKARKEMLFQLCEELGMLDYDCLGEHAGEDDLLDEVLAEMGEITVLPKGKQTVKYWLYTDRWAFLEYLSDQGVAPYGGDETGWLCTNEEMEVEIEVDFDAHTVDIVSFAGQKIKPVRIN